VILGLASSGAHSNGFSLIRRIVERSGIDCRSPAPFDQKRLLGDVLLAPTRIYVKPLLKLLRNARSIKALAHITGGGLVENVPRVLPENVAAEIDLATLPFPPVFQWLQQAGGIDDHEMLSTFNCGVGMVLITEVKSKEQAMVSLRAAGETVLELGRILDRPASGEQMLFKGKLSLPS
jgi:phosphoribosylformylglycinamidine cyclo-ligase